ncbi:hypothetical protein GMSM_18990 [Geomonas sp. Red276]
MVLDRPARPGPEGNDGWVRSATAMVLRLDPEGGKVGRVVVPGEGWVQELIKWQRNREADESGANYSHLPVTMEPFFS